MKALLIEEARQLIDYALIALEMNCNRAASEAFNQAVGKMNMALDLE